MNDPVEMARSIIAVAQHLNKERDLADAEYDREPDCLLVARALVDLVETREAKTTDCLGERVRPDQHNVFYDPMRDIYREAHNAWWDEHEHAPLFLGAPCQACDERERGAKIAPPKKEPTRED